MSLSFLLGRRKRSAVLMLRVRRVLRFRVPRVTFLLVLPSMAWTRRSSRLCRRSRRSLALLSNPSAGKLLMAAPCSLVAPRSHTGARQPMTSTTPDTTPTPHRPRSEARYPPMTSTFTTTLTFPMSIGRYRRSFRWKRERGWRLTLLLILLVFAARRSR